MSDSVYTFTEVVGTSTESWEKAATTAVERAARTLRDLRVAEVVKLDLDLQDGRVPTDHRTGASTPPVARASGKAHPLRPRVAHRRVMVTTPTRSDPVLRAPHATGSCHPVHLVHPGPVSSNGSRAPLEHPTVHNRHENGSDPGRTTRSEP